MSVLSIEEMNDNRSRKYKAYSFVSYYIIPSFKSQKNTIRNKKRRERNEKEFTQFKSICLFVEVNDVEFRTSVLFKIERRVVVTCKCKR